MKIIVLIFSLLSTSFLYCKPEGYESLKNKKSRPSSTSFSQPKNNRKVMTDKPESTSKKSGILNYLLNIKGQSKSTPCLTSITDSPLYTEKKII